MSPTCPHCFRGYSLRETPFRCANCAFEVDAVYAREWGDSHPRPRILRPGPRLFAANGLACDRCKRTASVRVCPHCHEELPPRRDSDRDRVIAIVGSVGAGKSHYITAVVERLIQIGPGLGFTCFAATDTTRKRFAEEFERPIAAGLAIAATSTATHVSATVRQPLIFTLDPSRESDGRMRCSMHLIFFDMAGEDIGSIDRLSLIGRYLLGAAGILVIVDPQQLDGVRRRRPAAGLLPSDPATRHVLPRVTQLLRSATGARGPLDIPLAVVLSKLDTILDLLGPWSSLHHAADHGRFPDSDYGHNVDSELRAHLREWGDEWLLHGVASDYPRARFFAVSALGGAPQKGRLLHAPLPRRIEDPILWVMQQDGVLREGRR